MITPRLFKIIMQLPHMICLQGLMVVGFDVCHDTTSKGKSFGAMVASLDKPFSRYFSAVSAHTSGEELSNYFTANIASNYMLYF